MKTLKQLFDEITNDIFRTFSDEHRTHITKMYQEKVEEWLLQNYTVENAPKTAFELLKVLKGEL